MEPNPITFLQNVRKKMYTDLYSRLSAGELADGTELDDSLKGFTKGVRFLKRFSTVLALGSVGMIAYDLITGKHHDALKTAQHCIMPVTGSLFAYHFHSAEKVLSAIYRRAVQGYEFSDEELEGIRHSARAGRLSHLGGATVLMGGLSALWPFYSLIAVPWIGYVGYAGYGSLYDALSDFAVGENRYGEQDAIFPPQE